MMRTVWLCILACALSVPACSSASSFPDRYDNQIQSAAKKFLPGIDWRLWKAQLYQESRLNPSAVSPVGAAGLAQFMPGTWVEVSRELGYGNISPHMTKQSIDAGAYYMAKMRKIWSAPRPEADRHSLAMASYNAGAGNLIKSQKKAQGASSYAEIIAKLPQVTGRYSEETKTYVQRIWSYWTQMLVKG
ncbi:transglycosylase SLT domain-containing protein [Neptunomonas phycophila]|uniref:transglycosylase SLT domain-containing protein n=1 Tax=Neptunomonas phycophila TaxID=1572645 RepID=UPI0026E1CE84|nr:transglycosylase SLT domain-containing protein [Neptunomonas phycophila]MDO6466791.1 transglycosylase SLT domain-containing protein [Neptunomonas phycophila]